MEITIKLEREEVEAAIIAYALRKTGIELKNVKEEVAWGYSSDRSVKVNITEVDWRVPIPPNASP